MDFICKSEMHPFTQFGALYQLVARRTGREHVNDYLYISENIYVQTEPHIFLQMSILSTPHTIYPTCPLYTPNIKINYSTLCRFPP